jgi:hypothetical protein
MQLRKVVALRAAALWGGCGVDGDNAADGKDAVGCGGTQRVGAFHDWGEWPRDGARQ